MGYTFLPHKNRLHCITIVSGLDLAVTSDPGQYLRMAMEDTSERVVRRIFKDCMTQTPHEGTKDITLQIDCYVFSRGELESLLLKARAEGQKDAERWMRMTP